MSDHDEVMLAARSGDTERLRLALGLQRSQDVNEFLERHAERRVRDRIGIIHNFEMMSQDPRAAAMNRAAAMRHALEKARELTRDPVLEPAAWLEAAELFEAAGMPNQAAFFRDAADAIERDQRLGRVWTAVMGLAAGTITTLVLSQHFREPLSRLVEWMMR